MTNWITSTQKQLPQGIGRSRLRLWDRYWRLLWDESTAQTPAYQHISKSAFGTVDDPSDGTREIYEFWRCPEGIRRNRLPSSEELLSRFIDWPRWP